MFCGKGPVHAKALKATWANCVLECEEKPSVAGVRVTWHKRSLVKQPETSSNRFLEAMCASFSGLL